MARWRCVIHIELHQEKKFQTIYKQINNFKQNKLIMIIVPVKEGDNIERALKKFKRKTEKTGVIKELRKRQAFEKPSITNRKKMMKAEYVQQLRAREE